VEIPGIRKGIERIFSARFHGEEITKLESGKELKVYSKDTRQISSSAQLESGKELKVSSSSPKTLPSGSPGIRKGIESRKKNR